MICDMSKKEMWKPLLLLLPAGGLEKRATNQSSKCQADESACVMSSF